MYNALKAAVDDNMDRAAEVMELKMLNVTR